jgi:hypothetical protein
LKETVSKFAKYGFIEGESRSNFEETKFDKTGADETGVAETMENEEFALDEPKQNGEKINFNTHEDELENESDTSKNYQKHFEKNDPDHKAEIMNNRNSTVIVSEGDMEEAHNYVQGMIKNIKKKHKPVKSVANYEEEKVNQTEILKITRNDKLLQNSVDNTVAHNSVIENNYDSRRDSINEPDSSIDQYNCLGGFYEKRDSGR